MDVVAISVSKTKWCTLDGNTTYDKMPIRDKSIVMKPIEGVENLLRSIVRVDGIQPSPYQDLNGGLVNVLAGSNHVASSWVDGYTGCRSLGE